jgi:lipopolysaccharide/colanic/teichoic acid biosynthesis glycosyltransferase
MKHEIIDFKSSGFGAAVGGLNYFSLDRHLVSKEARFSWLFNKCLALVGIALTAIFALFLLILNPFFNPGPVFYRQERMGAGGKAFSLWKFRTMSPSSVKARAPEAPVEAHRITPLGAILRKTRVDEIPNFINVWLGDMSVIGPRPDAFDHSVAYLGTIPGYAARFQVRPGITGLAQVRNGYADNSRAIQRKARLDRFYVERYSVLLDIYIVWMTVRVMMSGFGAK